MKPIPYKRAAALIGISPRTLSKYVQNGVAKPVLFPQTDPTKRRKARGLTRAEVTRMKCIVNGE